jgi:hypothetical protein
MMHRCRSFAIICASVWACAVWAESACQPHIDTSSPTPRLRVHYADTGACTIDEARYRAVVSAWLDASSVTPPGLLLGRVIDLPWIADYLAAAAAADRAWSQIERADTVGMNRAVARLLMQPEFKPRLEQPFVHRGLRLTSVAVEKVLVETAHSGMLLPFDAQLSLRLAPTR